MKLTKKQRILNFAKQHPEGFTPKQLLDGTKIKDKNIWVALAQMKKAGVLSHDPKTRLYKAADGSKVSKSVIKAVNDAVNAQTSRDVDTIAYLSNQIIDSNNKYKELSERHNDALAIIRYLENKLLIAIQHGTNA